MFCLFSLNVLIIPTLLFVFFLFKNSLSLFYKWVYRIMNFFYLLDLQFPIRFLSPLFVLIHTFCVCSFIFNLFLRVTIFSVIRLFLTVPRCFVFVFLFSLCTVREHTSLFPLFSQELPFWAEQVGVSAETGEFSLWLLFPLTLGN